MMSEGTVRMEIYSFGGDSTIAIESDTTMVMDSNSTTLSIKTVYSHEQELFL